MQSIKRSWRYVALALIATTLWGSALPGAKIGFQYMPPMMLSGIRFTLAGLLLIPMIFVGRIDWRDQLKHWRFMLLFGLIQSCLQYGLFYMGLDLIPAAVAAVVIGAGPLFVAVMAHLTLPNDKLNKRKVCAILLGVCGVAAISITDSTAAVGYPHFYAGIALLLLSNLIGSYTNIMVVKRNSALSPIMLTMGANFSGGVMLFIISLFAEDRTVLLQHFPLEFYGAILWLAIIPAAGFSIWYYLLSLPGVKVSELNVWKFVIPVVGIILSWVMLPGEHPTWQTVSGIIIISISVLILQYPALRGRS